MRSLFRVVISLIMVVPIFAQSDVSRLIDTEHQFARMAAEKGTKAAFLANLAIDGIVFLPNKANGIDHWNAQPESNSLLSWAPNFADVSANGILGYTTGNWEFRAKRDDGAAAAFGEFVSIWLRQPDGRYKCVVDIGVQHEKPDVFTEKWTTSPIGAKDQNTDGSSAADSASGFFRTVENDGLAKAYGMYAADDVRAFREGQTPILGKKAMVAFIKRDKAKYSLPKRTNFFGSADLSYSLNTYTKTVDGKAVERGNILQIWKRIGGKWRIALDLFKPAASV